MEDVNHITVTVVPNKKYGTGSRLFKTQDFSFHSSSIVTYDLYDHIPNHLAFLRYNARVFMSPARHYIFIHVHSKFEETAQEM